MPAPVTTRLAIAFVLAVGCGSREVAPPAAAIEVPDDRGRVVRLAAPAQRIVTLLPSHTETLERLGVADRLVGRDPYSVGSPAIEALPEVGGLEPNVEAVVALAPVLVLAAEYGTQAAVLEQAGITVWAGSAQTWDEVFVVLDAIGRLVGRRDRAAQIAREVRARVAVTEAALRDAPRVRVYFEIDPMLYTVGPRTRVGELIARAGGETICPASLGDFPQIAPEEIIARDPEVIIGLTLDEARARPGWGQITAVRDERVRALSPRERDAVVQPGPGLDRALRTLAAILHPEVALPPEASP